MKGEGARSTGGCVFGGMWAARQLQRGKRGRRAWKMAGGRSVMQLGRGQGRKTTEHWGSIQGRVGAACRRTREVRRTKHLRPGLRRQPPQLTAAATRSPTAAQRGTRGLQAASVVLPEVGGALVVDVDPGLYRDRRAAAAAAAADHAAAALARAAPAVAVAPAVAPAGHHAAAAARLALALWGPVLRLALLPEEEARSHPRDRRPRDALGHQTRRPRAAVEAGEAHSRLGAPGGPAPGRLGCECLLPLLQAVLARARRPTGRAGDCAHGPWARGAAGEAEACEGRGASQRRCAQACNRLR